MLWVGNSGPCVMVIMFIQVVNRHGVYFTCVMYCVFHLCQTLTAPHILQMFWRFKYTHPAVTYTVY